MTEFSQPPKTPRQRLIEARRRYLDIHRRYGAILESFMPSSSSGGYPSTEVGTDAEVDALALGELVQAAFQEYLEAWREFLERRSSN